MQNTKRTERTIMK